MELILLHTPPHVVWTQDGVNFSEQVVVIKSEVLRREYRRATNQLQLCTGGFGASPNSRSSARFCTELYSGKTSRFERSDILGVISPENLPKWAKHYLEGVQQAEKKARDREGR